MKLIFETKREKLDMKCHKSNTHQLSIPDEVYERIEAEEALTQYTTVEADTTAMTAAMILCSKKVQTEWKMIFLHIFK